MSGQTNGQHDDGGLGNGAGAFLQSDPDPSPAPPSGPPLSDFLTQLADYTPTIPDTVTAHYLAGAGLETSDPRIVKLVSLAAQKFVSDVAGDALTHCKMRQAGGAGTTARKGKEKKFVMTTEDLSLALAEQGVSVKKPPYYQ